MRLAIAALLLAGLVAESAWACRCLPPPPPKEALEKADAVFLGTVTRIEEQERHLVVTVRVVKSWKGVAEEEVQVRTHQQSAACGVSFVEQQAWLVYATQDPETQALRTNLCTRTKPVDGAEEEVKELGDPTWEAGAP